MLLSRTIVFEKGHVESQKVFCLLPGRNICASLPISKECIIYLYIYIYYVHINVSLFLYIPCYCQGRHYIR